MNSNTLRSGMWWLFKSAVLVGLSLIVIFLSSPKADAAVLTGDLVTSGGVPVFKIDEASILSFTDTAVAQQFWGNVGNQVKVDCVVRNSTMFDLQSVTVVSSGEKVWENTGAVLGDQIGGGLVVTPLDKIQGRLIVRHTQPAVDITPDLLYGGYSEVTLDGLGADLRLELLRLADGYGGNIIADGELDGLVLRVDNLWVNGVQRKQTNFAQ